MSLAINRQRIITAVYQDETEAAQVAPGPESAWYHPGQRQAATAFDPTSAEQLLEGLGSHAAVVIICGDYPTANRCTSF